MFVVCLPSNRFSYRIPIYLINQKNHFACLRIIKYTQQSLIMLMSKRRLE